MYVLISVAAAIAAFIYCGILLGIVLFQHKLAFPPKRMIDEGPEDVLGVGQCDDVMSDVPGGRTNIRYFPGAPDAFVFIYCGGHGNTMSDALWVVRIFQSLRAGIAICDYGGYGRSTGKSSEQRCYEDARALWRFLTNECSVDPCRIVLYGYSMGGGIVTQLATEEPCACLVLDSTFKSFPEIFQERARIFPLRRLIRIHFDNAAKVARVRSPVLVLHGRRDVIVPFHHGRTLFDLAPSPKRFVALDCNHDKTEADWETVVNAHVPAFLREVKSTPRPAGETP